MLSFYRNQNLCDSISEAIWTWQTYPLHVFCSFQRNKDDITIVAQHVRDLFTTAASERMAYQTGTYEMTYKSAQS